MGTSKEEIRDWLEKGKERGASHVIVVCDSFDHEDYPVYVEKGQNVRDVEKQYNGPNMQRVMEVYSLKLDIEKQLSEHRSFHYD
jgi:hypothetical protein